VAVNDVAQPSLDVLHLDYLALAPTLVQFDLLSRTEINRVIPTDIPPPVATPLAMHCALIL